MRTHLFPALWSAAAAALWFALAANNATQTYHFAPLIAAGAWPMVLAARHNRDVWAAGIGAFGIALAATIALALRDSLRGPDLVGGHAATTEAVVFAAAGALLAVGYRMLRQTTS